MSHPLELDRPAAALTLRQSTASREASKDAPLGRSVLARLLVALMAFLAILVGLPGPTHGTLVSIVVVGLPLTIVLTIFGIWIETGVRKRPFWPVALNVLEISCVVYLLTLALLVPLVLQSHHG